MAADLTLRIAAEFGQLKAELADLRRQLQQAGAGAAQGLQPANDALERTSELSRAAAESARQQRVAEAEAARQTRQAQADARRQQRQADAETARQARQAQTDAKRQQRQSEVETEQQRRQAERQRQRDAQTAQRAQDAVQRQSTAQQRQLAPQLTDITVGLATGQSPLMVLLQQGGQLKDLFGGIVPAARAVGGAVAALINPITILGGAIAALAIGYLKGADEAARFRRVLIDTGGVAGVTADELNAMAESIGDIAGSTRGAAADALAEVVESGRFAGEQIGLVGRAIEQVRTSSGRDASATVAEFAKIADDPVKGVEELNKRYGFLSVTLAAQIRTLQEQGRTQEASTLAMRAYADAIDDRAPKIRQELGLVEKAWRALKEGAKATADDVLNIGRASAPDPEKQFNDLVRRRLVVEQQLRDVGPETPSTGFRPRQVDPDSGAVGGVADQERARAKAELAQIEQQLRALSDAQVAAQKDAGRKAAQKRAVAAQEQLTAEARQFETAQERLTREKIETLNRAAQGLADAAAAADEEAQGKIAAQRAAIQAQIAKEQAKAAPAPGADAISAASQRRLAAIARDQARVPLAAAQANASLVRDDTDRAIQEQQRLFDRGLISAKEFFAARRRLQLDAVDADIAAQRAELATTQEQTDITRITAQLRVLERRKADIRRDAIRDEARATQALEEQLLDVDVGLQRDALDRALGVLQQGFERQGVAIEDFYAARLALQEASLDQEIALARKRLENSDLGPAERARILAETTRLERQKNDIRRQAGVDEARERADLEKQVAQLRAQDLENQGQTAAAARIRIEAQFAELLAKLGKDSEGARLVQKLIDTGVAKAQFDQLQQQANAALQQLERSRANIDVRVRTGELSPQGANEEEGRARDEALASLREANELMQALALKTGDPAIIEGAGKVAGAIQQIGEQGQGAAEVIKGDLRAALKQMNDSFAASAANAGVDALTNLFTDLVDGTKSASEALRDFVVGFVRSMAQIAARALATYLVLKFLEAATGIPAAAFGAAAGMSTVKVKHSGGMADQGTIRQVPSWIFAGAPRYHDGSGVIGLKAGEVPAILQEGERVQSRAEVAASQRGAGGGGNASGYRIVNVLDPNLVQDYLSSSAGERVILNHIERNAGAVRQKIGV